MSRARLGTPLLAAFDGLQEGVWLVDLRQRTILFSNAVAAALVGLDPAQLVGQPVLRFAATPQDQCFWADGAEVLAQGAQCQTQLLRGDGTLVPVEQRVVSCPQDLHAQALLVTLTDCSARQAAERELETLLSELRATLDSAADGMLVCTLDGQIRAFNQRFVQLWSLP